MINKQNINTSLFICRETGNFLSLCLLLSHKNIGSFQDRYWGLASVLFHIMLAVRIAVDKAQIPSGFGTEEVIVV